MGATHGDQGSIGLPGLSDEIAQEARIFLTDDDHVKGKGVRIGKDTDDEANVGKEHKLRPGLAVVRVEAGGATQGHYVDANHADAPNAASIVEAGLLMHGVDMRDREGSGRQDQPALVLKHGFVDVDKVDFGTADGPTIQAIKDALPLVQFETNV